MATSCCHKATRCHCRLDVLPRVLGGHIFLHFRTIDRITSVFVGKVGINARGKTFGTFYFRVASLLGGKSGLLRIGMSGDPSGSVTPLTKSFAIFKKVCHPMSLLLLPGAYVAPLSCTSSKVCVRRSRISSGQTRLSVIAGIGDDRPKGTLSIEADIFGTRKGTVNDAAAAGGSCMGKRATGFVGGLGVSHPVL